MRRSPFAAANRFVYSRANQIVIDGALVAMALCASYLFRFDGELPAPYERQLLLVLPFAVALYLAINVLAGVYKRIWRFFGLWDAAAIAHSVALAFLVSVLWRILDPGVLAGHSGPVWCPGDPSVSRFWSLGWRASRPARPLRSRRRDKRHRHRRLSASACCWLAPGRQAFTCCAS